MEIDQGWIVALITGIAIPLLGLKLAPGTLGRLLFASQERENSALATLSDVTREAIAGWRESSTRNATLEVQQTGMERDATYRYQHTSNRLDDIDLKIAKVIRILAERDNGAG